MYPVYSLENIGVVIQRNGEAGSSWGTAWESECLRHATSSCPAGDV